MGPSLRPALVQACRRTMAGLSPLRRTYATTSSTTTLQHPPSRQPHKSAKLSALHSRLSLHPNFPLETLAKCLIHPTASADPATNNAGLSNFGNNLLGYYTAEHLLTTYPRLPMNVLRAAIWAYISPDALASVGREWGIEAAFEPTWEVDAGLLQFKRLEPGAKWGPELYEELERQLNEQETRMIENDPVRLLSRADEDVLKDTVIDHAPRRTRAEIIADLYNQQRTGIPLSLAMSTFVKAVFGAIYLHESPASSHQFFRAHIQSRHLPIHKLFSFEQPTRQLSRLCAREGFEPPVARLLSETGRKSKSPVFVVGVYSGEERLGEGYGSSLDEARIRAAVAALRSWYLYSPPARSEGRGDLPSVTEEGNRGLPSGQKVFKPAYIDVGEVIV